MTSEQIVDRSDIEIALEQAQSVEDDGFPTAAACIRACANAAKQVLRAIETQPGTSNLNLALEYLREHPSLVGQSPESAFTNFARWLDSRLPVETAGDMDALANRLEEASWHPHDNGDDAPEVCLVSIDDAHQAAQVLRKMRAESSPEETGDSPLPCAHCECPGLHEKASDAEAGMTWWNGLTERERAAWMERAGSAVPADAWRLFQSGAENGAL